MKSATPVNTQVIWKQNSLLADAEKVGVVWRGNLASHNTPLSPILNQSKALTCSNSRTAEGGEEATEEKFQVCRGWFLRSKKRSHVLNIEVQGKVSANAEASVSYPEGLVK